MLLPCSNGFLAPAFRWACGRASRNLVRQLWYLGKVWIFTIALQFVSKVFCHFPCCSGLGFSLPPEAIFCCASQLLGLQPLWGPGMVYSRSTSIVPVALYNAGEIACYKWKQPVLAVCGIVPVAAILPLFPSIEGALLYYKRFV